jgi:Ceramidase
MNPVSPSSLLSAPALSRREIILAAIALLVLALPFLLPQVPQSQSYHRFADTRTLFGVANAMDTLSNLGFIIAGVIGIVLVWLRRLPAPTTALGAMSLLTFAGLIATGIGSAWYHGQVPPNDAGLAIDRYGMVISFAGVLGLAAAHRVSERAGWWTGWIVLVAGPFSVWWWTVSGNVAPYAALQFGGMALIVLMLFWRDTPDASGNKSAGPNWGMLIGAYALAKVLEAADEQVWELTAHLTSGHTLKHLAAAFVALAVIAPLYRRNR